MAKRGSSGISCVLGIDKPLGMSSHDVVNVVRSVFKEKRVGHAGTLDPLASGILVVCVGPAARLNKYLVEHDKTYQMGITLGCATSTDDAEGQVIARGAIKQEYFDEGFARRKIDSLVGKISQIPPAYSAIKVNGEKAYAAARSGKVIDLKPREIEIFSAQLQSIETKTHEDGSIIPVWNVEMHVSKGTYMRSIARDLGNSLGCFAYVSSLRRTTVGNLSIRQCCTLGQLKESPELAYVDPLQLLKVRYAFVQDEEAIQNGKFFSRDSVSLNEPIENDIFGSECCTTSVFPSSRAPEENEIVALLSHNRVKGLYHFDSQAQMYKPSCIFLVGVNRGSGL